MQKLLDKKLIIGIAVAVVAIVGIVVAVATSKPTIQLNEYVTVAYTGYDSLGEAEVSFDMEAFCEAYEGKLEAPESAQSEGTELFAKRVIKDSKLDKENNLSNGDVIVYQWDFSVSALEEVYGCKIECSDIKFTVTGLEEIETVDVFTGVEIVYEGIAPFAKATVKNNSKEDYAKLLSFTTDATNLGNGDTFTVAIDFTEDFGNVNGYIETYGKVPEKTEKEFVVEGLPEYITKTSQLSEDVLSSLKQQAEDTHVKHVAEEWLNGEHGNSAKVTGFEYVGTYVLKSNETSLFGRSLNKVLMVYKVTAHAESKFETLSLSGDTTYYTCIGFDDAYIDKDGTLVTSETSLPQRTNHELELNHDTNTWYTRTFFFYGYSTLDELYENEVELKSNVYTYETNIK